MVHEELFVKGGESKADPGRIMRAIKWTNAMSKEYALAIGTVVEGIVRTDKPIESNSLINSKINFAIKRLVSIKRTMPSEFKNTMAEQRVEDLNRAVVEMFKGYQARLMDGEFKTPQDSLKYYRGNVMKQTARSFDLIFGTSLRKDILKAAGY